MIQRHKNRLLLQEPTNSGFVWINELEKNKIILNCKKLEWDSLYPNVIIQLSNENLIELEDSKKRNLKYFLENKAILKIIDHDMYNVLKYQVNRLYSELLINNSSYTSLITTYIKMYYTEILQNNPNIFYVDVEQVYYTDEIDYFDLLDLGIEYKITDINAFFFSAKKRYIEISDGVTIHKGFVFKPTDKLTKIGDEYYSVEGIISNMKSALREKQISSVID
jgi:hypothetical protein